MSVCRDVEKKRVATMSDPELPNGSSSETVEQDPAEKVEKPQDSCSCFEYMKAHPGFFATLVSAFIAVVAFVLNAALYRRIGIYLQYWGFSNVNVDVTLGHQIYVLSMTLLFCVASSCITVFLCETFSVYQKHSNIFSYLKLANKQQSRKLRLARLSVWQISIRLKFLDWKYGQPSQTDDLNAKLKDEKERLNSISQRCEETNEMISMLRRGNIRELLPSLLLADILTFAFVWILAATKEIFQVKEIFLAAVSITVFLDALIYSLVKVESILLNSERWKIKTALKKDPEKAYDMIKDIANRDIIKYPMTTIVKSKTSDLFTNRRIVLALILVVCSLISVFFSFSGGKDESTIRLREFATTQIDGQMYVIIYNNGTTYYLSEAKVKESAIEINTEKQRITVSNDISFEVKEYAHVIKLPQTLGA